MASIPGGAAFNGTLLFGGQGEYGMLSDTWNFSLWGASPQSLRGEWSEVNSEASPTARVFGTLVVDTVDSSLLLLGGCEAAQCPALDPWVFSLQGPPSSSGGPPPGPGPPPPPPPSPPLWPWNITILTTNTSAGSQFFPVTPRFGMAAAWDPRDGPVGYVLFVGGRMSNGATLAETDVLAGYVWTDLAEPG
jgi:hypothetical protein